MDEDSIRVRHNPGKELHDYEETISILKSLVAGSFGDPLPVLARMTGFAYPSHEALEVYDLILQVMRKFHYERITLEAGVKCLLQMVEMKDKSWLSRDVRQKTTRTLLEVMERNKRSPSLVHDSLMVLYQFHLPTDCGEDFLKVVRLVMKVIVDSQQRDKSLKKVAVEVLRLSASQATPKVKEEMSKIGVIKTLVKIIKYKMGKGVKGYQLEIEWMAIWSLLEGAQTNSVTLVEECGGMQIFLDSLEFFENESGLLYYITGVLSAIAMVRSLRSYIRQFTEILLKLVEILQHPTVSFDVACEIVEILTFLASDGDLVWKKDVKHKVDLSVILDFIESKLDHWSVSHVRQRAYYTLAPLLDLLLLDHTPQCQYWASWAMANRFYFEAKRYSNLLDEDGGGALIEEILARNVTDPKTDQHLKIVLSSYNKTKHGISSIALTGYTDNMEGNQHPDWEDSDYWNSSSSSQSSSELSEMNSLHSASDELLTKHRKQKLRASERRSKTYIKRDPGLASGKKKRGAKKIIKFLEKQNQEDLSFLLKESVPDNTQIQPNQNNAIKLIDDKQLNNAVETIEDHFSESVSIHSKASKVRSTQYFQKKTIPPQKGSNQEQLYQNNYHVGRSASSCCGRTSHCCDHRKTQSCDGTSYDQHCSHSHFLPSQHSIRSHSHHLGSYENLCKPFSTTSNTSSNKPPLLYNGEDIIIQIHSKARRSPPESSSGFCSCQTPASSRTPSSHYKDNSVCLSPRITTPKPFSSLLTYEESLTVDSVVEERFQQSPVMSLLGEPTQKPASPAATSQENQVVDTLVEERSLQTSIISRVMSPLAFSDSSSESVQSSNDQHSNDGGYLRLEVCQVENVVAAGPDTYDTSTTPGAIVYIFNFLDFNGRHAVDIVEERREGSQYDLANLHSLFSQMGYEINLFTNLTRREFIDKVEEIRMSVKLKEVGSFVFIVMSHGYKRHTLLTSDMDYVTVKFIQDQFTEEACPNLQGKPKVFFYNISKAPNLPKWMQNTRWQSIREDVQDTLVVFSPLKKFNIDRAQRRGTSFIRVMCKLFAMHAATMNLMQLLEEYKHYNISPKIYNLGFRKAFFFNPRKMVSSEN